MPGDAYGAPAPGIVQVESVEELYKLRQSAAERRRRVGFVPTMGALHEGHLDLVREAARHSDEVYVSIFVNPAQFAPHEDLDRYPRPLHADLAALRTLDAALARDPAAFPGRVTAVFTPSVAAIYPSSSGLAAASAPVRVAVAPALAGVLEGRSRPGFFDGVATVMTKLLALVRPFAAFMGQKDFQQCVVLERLTRELFLGPAQGDAVTPRIWVVPTARESDGLARSSRNRFLGKRRRAVAPVLARALEAGVKGAREGSDGKSVRAAAVAVLENTQREQVALPPARRAKFEIDYLAVVARDTLQEIMGEQPVPASAVLTGALIMQPLEELESSETDLTLANPVRLIDNMFVDPKGAGGTL